MLKRNKGGVYKRPNGSREELEVKREEKLWSGCKKKSNKKNIR